MKSVFLDKSLGMDIREESIGLTLMGKKLRIAEVLAGDFIKLKPLTGKDEKAEKLLATYRCTYQVGPQLALRPAPDILFGPPRLILKYLEDTGHSTAPIAPDVDAEVAAE